MQQKRQADSTDRQHPATITASDHEFLISEHCPSEEVYLVLGVSEHWQAEGCTDPTVHQQTKLNPV